MSGQNTIVIETWNTVLFEKFCRFRHVLTDGFSDHSDELFRRTPYPLGARVLEIGCGFGDTTRQIAKQVGPSGAAIGVDWAEKFVDDAIRETEESDISNASFFVGDAESVDLRGPYDGVFSRFGTMFFGSPEVAFRNIRRAIKPGGELAMIVWRRREDNPWVHRAELLVKQIVSVQVAQEKNGPGPFSMTGPDTVSDVLRDAGFDRITFERYDTDVCIGRTLDEAVEFAMTTGPAGETMRHAAEEGIQRGPDVIKALQALFAPRARPNGIWFGSSTWFVRARNPTA